MIFWKCRIVEEKTDQGRGRGKAGCKGHEGLGVDGTVLDLDSVGSSVSYRMFCTVKGINVTPYRIPQ